MPLTEYRAAFQQTADDPRVSVTLIAPEEIRTLPRAEAEERLSALLHQVRARPELILYGVGAFSSYVEGIRREALLGHNTLVEVNLPYTLHLPQSMPFPVLYGQAPGPATVCLRKVWTSLAEGSNDADIFADDQLLYYGPAQPSSPTLPQASNLGPWPHFTGKNVEIYNDAHGVFRYTQVRVLFDQAAEGVDGLDDSEVVQNARSSAVRMAVETATGIVNYLLDVYRFTTGEDHVERLAKLPVTRVYFADANLVYESAGIEAGLGSAIANRSRREIQGIRDMLAVGREPARDVLLLQSARSALERGQLLLAVIVSFQALEIVVEEKLRAGFSALALSDAQVAERFKACYRTKDRLTTLSREAFGNRSVADDGPFWTTWLTDCNQKRNAVVHRGEAINHSEAKRLVALCEECVTRVSAL
jgi:hypothetical protein